MDVDSRQVKFKSSRSNHGYRCSLAMTFPLDKQSGVARMAKGNSGVELVTRQVSNIYVCGSYLYIFISCLLVVLVLDKQNNIERRTISATSNWFATRYDTSNFHFQRRVSKRAFKRKFTLSKTSCWRSGGVYNFLTRSWLGYVNWIYFSWPTVGDFDQVPIGGLSVSTNRNDFWPGSNGWFGGVTRFYAHLSRFHANLTRFHARLTRSHGKLTGFRGNTTD